MQSERTSLFARMAVFSRGLLMALQLQLSFGGAVSTCKDAATCQAHLKTLVQGLDSQRQNLTSKQMTLSAIEALRDGIMSGKRIGLPTTHRQHLEKSSPLVSEVSFDSKHRPVSTNLSRHLKFMRNVADEVEVRIHTIMPLKKSSQKMGPSALMVTIDARNHMSIHTLEGDVRLSDFDLGHAQGAVVTQLVLSPNQENHFAVTADDTGEVRVHTLKVSSQKAPKNNDGIGQNVSDEELEKADEKPEEKFEQKHGIKQMHVSANFSVAFTIPASTVTGEQRRLTTVLPVERGSQVLFVTGDSLGGIGVFHRNGTLKGRVKVTEDFGGVKGLLRGQGQTVLFYSSHSFGFFSVSQVDVQYPPCTGWNSPVFDIAPDPSLSYAKVILALSDGDVLVFSTTKGKNKACDLTMKFPRISSLPYKLQVFRGHVIALPTPLDTTHRKDEYLRELHFFNTNAMEAGYGTSTTRVVTLQANFAPRKPQQFALFSGAAGGGGGGGGDKSKVQL